MLTLKLEMIDGICPVTIRMETTTTEMIKEACQYLDIPEELGKNFGILLINEGNSLECMAQDWRPYLRMMTAVEVRVVLRLLIFPAPSEISTLPRSYVMYALKQAHRLVITRTWKTPNEYSLVLSVLWYYSVHTQQPSTIGSDRMGLKDKGRDKNWFRRVKYALGDFVCSDILARYNDRSLNKMFLHIIHGLEKSRCLDDPIEHYFNVLGTAVRQYGYACFPGTVKLIGSSSICSDTLICLNGSEITFLNLDLSTNASYSLEQVKQVELELDGFAIKFHVIIDSDLLIMEVVTCYAIELISFYRFYRLHCLYKANANSTSSYPPLLDFHLLGDDD
ncbi:hypothetical protein GMRT_12341 [Giardia muris]|uniref:FERM domain-containing protein n=1 Tax=Giardia muris TaxID=5742 RepID=A0A4Z1T078_GIAMU|nr:hypothetical protein GMRT_12341 [Giardia muris]|eukprot:TNJ27303.1 hypothetical protein GMRT_12341 [Giardia muris]